MFDLSSVLTVLPKSVSIPLVFAMAGGFGFWAHEVRYMTVADFTKSYILDLKREIRENRNDLAVTTDTRARAIIIENIEALLDELCLEMPTDTYCKDR